MRSTTFRRFASLCLALVTAASLHAQDRKDSWTIVTSGSAERALRPDKARLSIGIEVHAATAGEASATLSTQMAGLRTALAGFPSRLDSIETVGYNVGPNYDYSERKTLIDYEASAVLRLSLRDLSALGRLVDVALGAGATDIAGVTFESDSAAVVRRLLLAEALADARADAGALATASGAQLAEAVEISTALPEGFRYGGAGFATSGYSSSGAITINRGGAIGPQNVVVSVNVYTSWRAVRSAK